MPVIQPSVTLAALVDQRPELARELERLALDYCCGGDRTLAEASAAAGLDLGEVVSSLSAVAGPGTPARWASLSAVELVDHIEGTHHRYLWDELARLSAMVDKVVSVHGERHPELGEVAACYAEIRADLEAHLLKEERVLFPMIRELAAASERPAFPWDTLGNHISVMLAEHDTVGGLLARLRRLTAAHQPPADGCASYEACYRAFAELEADTHLHIHKENNVLVPLVVRLEGERSPD